MRSEKRLRDELQFVTDFNLLFDVVQQVAVTQSRRLDDLLAAAPPLIAQVAGELFPLLPAAAAAQPLLTPGDHGRLVVLVTSDEGLVGPLHTAVAREARYRGGERTEWVCVGLRGPRWLSAAPGSTRVLPLPPEERTAEQMCRVADYVRQRYVAGRLREAWFVAARYLSPTRHVVAAHQLLPLPVVPATQVLDGRALIVEPSLNRVVERLAEAWTNAVCVEGFWSARRAEYAARAMHVEGSRQELARRSRGIRHAFFKTVHARVDVLVRETCVVQRHAAQLLKRRAR